MRTRLKRLYIYISAKVRKYVKPKCDLEFYSIQKNETYLGLKVEIRIESQYFSLYLFVNLIYWSLQCLNFISYLELQL